MPLRRTALLALALALNLAVAREADACSCMDVGLGTGTLYLGEGNRVPAGAKGFAWWGSRKLADAPDRVSVVRLEGTRRIAVKHTIVAHGELEIITPTSRLKPGQVYEVTIRESPDGARARLELKSTDLPPAEVTTTITVAAEPLRLPQLALRREANLSQWLGVAAGGTCSASLFADTVALAVELPPELQPWRDYLVYTTRVDGNAWHPRNTLCDRIAPGRTWTDRAATDLIYARSDHSGGFDMGTGGLDVGPHAVQIDVATPDGAQVISTAAVNVALTYSKVPTPEPTPTPAPSQDPPPPAQEPPPPAQEPPPVAGRGCAIDPHPTWWMLALAPLLRRRRRLTA